MPNTYLRPAHRALIELLAEIVVEELAHNSEGEQQLDGASGRGKTANQKEHKQDEQRVEARATVHIRDIVAQDELACERLGPRPQSPLLRSPGR